MLTGKIHSLAPHLYSLVSLLGTWRCNTKPFRSKASLLALRLELLPFLAKGSSRAAANLLFSHRAKGPCSARATRKPAKIRELREELFALSAKENPGLLATFLRTPVFSGKNRVARFPQGRVSRG